MSVGSSGSEVRLLANYFPITSYTNWCLYQYRVDFDPEEDRISTKKGLLAQHKERFGGYLFDGSMLFTSVKLDPDVSIYIYHLKYLILKLIIIICIL